MMGKTARGRALLAGPAVVFLGAFSVTADAADTEALEQRVRELERELEQAQRELAEAEAAEAEAEARTRRVEAEMSEITPAPSKIKFGHLTVGGAIRANYAIGDYPNTENSGASRAWENGGNFDLDTFRINLDYLQGPWQSKVEYRWYNGYNMLHTGWLGYNFEDKSQVQAGVNRVPFGPGPYGVSQSWFFDQHYYLGLSDDMDFGVKYHRPIGNWAWDVAYYYSDEGDYTGSSRDSARYSYDIVNESGNGYEERNQFNLRGIYTVPDLAIATDLGFSLQYGELKSRGPQDDGDRTAGSVHMINKWRNFTLATQATWYKFDIDGSFLPPLRDPTVQGLAPAGSLVQFGAYDFPSTAAAEAWLPAVSLSYHLATPQLHWVEYVIPYIEYSAVIKEEDSFNDSELFIVGAAWARGGWYIYTDLAMSNGNEFVGGDTNFGDRLGANQDDRWLTRFNINFGYYF